MAQIGSIKVQTQNNGIVILPVFETADAGGVQNLLRVQTAGGVGFIPLVSTGDAAFPYLRVQTQNHGVLAAHDQATLIQTEDFENQSIHLDSILQATNWSGDTGQLSIDSSTVLAGSYSLNMHSANAISVSSTISIDVAAVEFRHRWTVNSWDPLGDSFYVQIDADNGDNLVSWSFELDDTPEGSDQPCQPRINGNDVNLSQDTTYTIRIEFDWANDTFDFLVDGTPQYTGLAISNAASYNASDFVLQIGGDDDGNDWDQWLDDITIEPT